MAGSVNDSDLSPPSLKYQFLKSLSKSQHILPALISFGCGDNGGGL